MRIALSATQLELKEGLRAALQKACPPSVVRAAWEAPQPSLWEALAELGVLGASAPEEAGGLGMGASSWVPLLEECGRAAVPGPVIEAIAAAPFLAEAGELGLAERVAGGEALVTLLTEEGFALEADRAERILALEGDRAFAIESPRIIRQPCLDRSRRLFSVEGERRPLGGDAQDLRLRAELACAAQLLGLGRRLIEVAVDYAKTRRQFGKAIGSFQAVQHHLVDATLKLRFAAPVLHRAALSLDEGHLERGLHVSMAKIYASEAALSACRRSLQAHGAIGYTEELDLHLWMKRIWALAAAWGSAATHLDRVAGVVLGASTNGREEHA